MSLPSATDRFWAKIVKGAGPNDCWDWSGFKLRGYGIFSVAGKRVYIHRYSFYLAHGRYPTPIARHICDNRACTNPRHLTEGTIQDNMADKMERQRQAKGQDVGTSKLTTKTVRRIKSLLHSPRPLSLRKLAKQFRVSHNALWQIKTGRTWGWV